jgi:voltage-gated potassium channel
VPVYTVQPDAVAASVFQSLRRRFLNALLVMTLVTAGIMLGFFTIDAVQDPDGAWGDHWFEAVWNTLNLVSTVGSLTLATPVERAWGLLAIVIGLGAVLYGFGTLMAMFTGDVAQMLERRRMRRRLDDMKEHIVVCGYGRVGRAVAADLRLHGAELVAIDSDSRAVTLANDDGHTAVQGDCTRTTRCGRHRSRARAD